MSDKKVPDEKVSAEDMRDHFQCRSSLVPVKKGDEPIGLEGLGNPLVIPPALQLMIEVVDDIIRESESLKSDGIQKIDIDPQLFPISGWKEHCRDLVFHIQEKRLTVYQKLPAKLEDAECVWIVGPNGNIENPVDYRIFAPIPITLIKRKSFDEWVEENPAPRSQAAVAANPNPANDSAYTRTANVPAEPPATAAAPTQKAECTPANPAQAAENQQLRDRLLMAEKNHGLEIERLNRRIAALETANAQREKPAQGAKAMPIERPKVEFDFRFGISAVDLTTAVNDGWEIHTLQISPPQQIWVEDPYVHVVLKRLTQTATLTKAQMDADYERKIAREEAQAAYERQQQKKNLRN